MEHLYGFLCHIWVSNDYVAADGCHVFAVIFVTGDNLYICGKEIIRVVDWVLILKWACQWTMGWGMMDG